MKSYLITYDLMKPGQNYEKLFEAIKTDSTAEQVRNRITPHIDKNDKLFVAQLTGEAAWIGLSEEVSKWLRANL